MICPDWNKNDLKIIALKLFSLALDVQWLRFPDLDWFHFPRWPQTDVITGRSRALEASTCCLYSSTNQIAASSVSQLAPLYVSNSARGHWSAPVCTWLYRLIDRWSDRLRGRYGCISTWPPAAAAAAVFSFSTETRFKQETQQLISVVTDESADYRHDCWI